uniref:AP-3 complex subunit delta n=1 Tax=Trichobilharzia regenti TaxID=157069 RepID=A0AA85IZD3_TRIRE|nr:unnamed protein product [Trichobilharzia regenti]
MLATNLIRKDLTSTNLYDAGIALSGVACFINSDLATDLYPDILSLMNSPKPYLRKKAVLLLYKVFLNYPEALPICFPQLRDKLDDSDPGVQSAAVNVICELARKNPKNYLSLSPIFFKLMTTSSNNWVLIKIIKLFGTLTPLEPRLGKKLIGPLTNLIHSTSAMSLLYECINTVVAVLISISSGIPSHQASIQLCVQKLRILIEDSDQNLKYLGLLAMRKILLYHPQSVQPHKDLILSCLDDKDESIRLRALDLLHGMVSKTNLTDIVKHLMIHIANTSSGTHYRNELLNKVVYICSQDNYHYVASFEWYVTVLVELASIDGIRNGELLAAQLMDVAIRVPTVRAFCVEQMAILLDLSQSLTNGAKQNAIQETLRAAAWICGEYANSLSNPEQTLNSIISIALEIPGLSFQERAVSIHQILNLILKRLTKIRSFLTNSSPSSCVPPPVISNNSSSPSTDNHKLSHNAENSSPQLQLLNPTAAASNDNTSKMNTTSSSSDNNDDAASLNSQPSSIQLETSNAFPPSTLSPSLVINLIQSMVDELNALFAGEIIPVAPKAQKRVPIPEGLDLDAWINPPGPVCKPHWTSTIDFVGKSVNDDHSMHSMNNELRNNSEVGAGGGDIFTDLHDSKPSTVKLTPEQLDELRSKRLERQQNNPNYLKPKEKKNNDASQSENSFTEQSRDVDNSDVNESTKSTEFSSQHLQKPNSGRTLATSDQFVVEIRKRFQTVALNDDRKLRSIGDKSKKVRKKKHCVTSSPSSSPPPSSISIDSKRMSREENDKNHIMNKLASHVVRCEYDMPEGVTVDNESLTDPEDINDPHHRLNIVFDNFITQDNNKLNPSSTPCQRAKKRQVTHKTSSNKSSKLSSKNNNKVNKISREDIESQSMNDTNCTENVNPSQLLDCNDATTCRSGYVAFDSDNTIKQQRNKKSSKTAPSKTSLVNNKNGKNDHQSLVDPKSSVQQQQQQHYNSELITNPASTLSSTTAAAAATPQYCRSLTMRTSDQFAALLSSGQLNAFQSTKIQCPHLLSVIQRQSEILSDSPTLAGINNTKIFSQIISFLQEKVPCSIIESLDSRAAASLYTESIPHKEPLCILMKVSFATGTIRMDIRSTNQLSVQLCNSHLTNLVKQMKF